MKRVSVDIGGTFTDCFVVWDDHYIEGKALTTHHNLAQGFNDSLVDACKQLGLEAPALLSQVDSVRYATTLGTNALIERKGPRVGALVTTGFKSTIPLRQPRNRRALYLAPPVIVGSGLTMVDRTVSLDRRGHCGPITVLSRRGLLPSAHRPTMQSHLAEPEVPFGSDLSASLAWIRGLATRLTAEGADWRSAVDALRPHTQRLWRSMTLEQKRRFCRHARTYWDIHRHRMAPELERHIAALRASGRLKLIAGRILGAKQAGDSVRVSILRRGFGAAEDHRFARVIDCTGLPENPKRSVNPLIRALFARGSARVDPLGIGLDVAENYALLDAEGRPSRRVQVIGPLARAAFWECIAIPDIWLQCEEIAEAFAAELAENV